MHKQVWKMYFLGWIPLFLFYAVAANNDWNFSKGFNFLGALFGASWGIGPAMLLLMLLWPITGWMERRALAPAKIIGLHLLLAPTFAFVWHASMYVFLYFVFSPKSANRAYESWFVWQGMWGMMLYAAVAGGFHAYRAVEQARAQERAKAQAESLLVQTELAALRNKLNPHFLFNTLHSIIALTRKDGQQAEAALLRFSDMLRYVLDVEKSGQDQVTLRQELEFVRDYLELEALRLGTRLTVKWDVQEETLSYAVPALSVQPIVENSIKHAFNPHSRPGTLAVSAWLDAATNAVCIKVADDGPGCAQDPLHDANGLGIKTVARRLALAYGSRSRFSVLTSPGQGFAVDMALPATSTF
jgi:signal transduction histidine kinase